jgi:hypothetical protein
MQTEYSTQKEYNAANVQIVSPYGFTNVPCSSAKSMYRLCDSMPLLFCTRLVKFTIFLGLGISTLKEAALMHITSSLTPENITHEFCSTFTSKYDEVRRIEQEYLIGHWVCLCSMYDSVRFLHVISSGRGQRIVEFS